jgi:hypothetical protein
MLWQLHFTAQRSSILQLLPGLAYRKARSFCTSCQSVKSEWQCSAGASHVSACSPPCWPWRRRSWPERWSRNPPGLWRRPANPACIWARPPTTTWACPLLTIGSTNTTARSARSAWPWRIRCHRSPLRHLCHDLFPSWLPVPRRYRLHGHLRRCRPQLPIHADLPLPSPEPLPYRGTRRASSLMFREFPP